MSSGKHPRQFLAHSRCSINLSHGLLLSSGWANTVPERRTKEAGNVRRISDTWRRCNSLKKEVSDKLGLWEEDGYEAMKIRSRENFPLCKINSDPCGMKVSSGNQNSKSLWPMSSLQKRCCRAWWRGAGELFGLGLICTNSVVSPKEVIQQVSMILNLC